MDLSIIIISWNVKEKLKENLAALLKSAGGLSYEIFVVDNASADETAEMVRHDFPEVKLIVNKKNLGFAKANNQALKQATGRYVLLLNPDMKVFPDTLSKMLNWLDANHQAAVAGCKLVNEHGEIIKQVRCFPTLADQLAIVLKLPHLFPEVLNNYLRNDFNYEKSAAVDSIRGGFFMIRREIIEKIGLLDERFFLWFEEVDYCQRVKRAGLEVWYTNSAKCLDYIGQSFKQLNRGVAQKYFRDSMLKYFKKWRPGCEYVVLKLAWPIGLLIAKLGDVMKIKSKTRT